MKDFYREDSWMTFEAGQPYDMNDPEGAKEAIGLTLPEGFSEKAKAAWNYFDDTAFLFLYKDRLVVTDESLWLSEYGDGSLEAPMGGPRWECDTWEELEQALEGAYDDLKADGMI
jgi:hypothetical protein